MKKIFWVFFIALTFLFLTFGQVRAEVCDESAGGTKGLVPCGGPGCPCEIYHLFILVANVYNFLVFNIATPLAVLAILAGGIMLLISGGNPGLAGKGKQTITIAIIGLVLVFGAWLIINAILLTLTGHGLP